MRIQDSLSPRLEDEIEKCVCLGGCIVFFVMYIGENRAAV